MFGTWSWQKTDRQKDNGQTKLECLEILFTKSSTDQRDQGFDKQQSSVMEQGQEQKAWQIQCEYILSEQKAWQIQCEYILSEQKAWQIQCEYILSEQKAWQIQCEYIWSEQKAWQIQCEYILSEQKAW